MKIRGKDRIKVIIAGIVAAISLAVLFYVVLWRFLRKNPETIYQSIISQEKKEEKPEEDRVDLYHKNIDPNVIFTPEGKKHYRNEEYGFEFDFPADWTLKQPAFGNTPTVLFNLEIINQPRILPNPILIGILREDRTSAIISKEEEQDNIEKVIINGIEWKKNMSPSDGLPHIHYLFNLREYWIDVGGKTQYEGVLDDILSTFKFIERE